MKKTLVAYLLMANLVSFNVQAQDLSPQPQTVKGVTFLNGGVGEIERQEMLAMKKEYNLHLLFVDKVTGAYTADVRVRIQDAKGASILDGVSQGPFFYAKLNPGKFRITVSSNSQEQTQSTVISARKAVSKTFYFKDQATPAQ
jgi:hypothetical protein